MKKVITLLFILLTVKMNAQTWNEWMQQKKTQIKYLHQQIAALQMYSGYVKQGYKIARTGLNTIGNIREGEWNLHEDFFESLKTVNPVVKRCARIADIISMQTGIVQDYRSLMRLCGDSKIFSASQMAYVQKVCNHVLVQCVTDINELIAVTTDGELQMSDDERLKAIERMYLEVQEKKVFLQSFGNTIMSLIRGNKHEKMEIELSKILNGIK